MSVFIGEKGKRVELAERKDAINPNLLLNSEGPFQPQNSNADNYQVYPGSTIYLEQNQTYTISGQTNGTWSGTHNSGVESDKCVIWFVDGTDNTTAIIVSSDNQVNNSNQFVWTNPTGTYQLRVNGYKKDNSTKAWNIKVEKGSVATPWCPAYDDYASNSNFNTLQNNVYTKPEVDSKTSGNVVTAYDVASKKPTTVQNSYTSEELVDQGVLGQFADQINQLKGRQTVDAPDFNTLTDSGVYYISNPSKGKNFPSTSWGTLAVFNGNGARITQLYAGDDGVNVFMRIYGSGSSTTWNSWNQIAWTSDVTNLQNTVNSKVNVDGDLFLSPGSINSWADVQADGNKNVLRSVRTEGTGTDFNTGNYDAGILFGGNDTKALISVGYTGNTARVSGGNDSGVWHEDIAWKSDITNLNNTITALTTRLTNAESEISYIKANYIEGKQFPASQEAQAVAWENANPQGIAFITSN